MKFFFDIREKGKDGSEEEVVVVVVIAPAMIK